MTVVVARNHLLLGLLAAITAYAIFGYVMPHPWLSFAGAAAQLIGGCLGLGMYGVDAARIIASPDYRNPESPKSHRLVLGVALVSLGAVYSGVASILYIMNGSPADWIGNPLFYVGRYITAGGFVFLYLAPEEKRTFLLFRPSLTMAVLMVFALALMFVLGARFGPSPHTSFEESIHRSATYPVCPEHEPVWVTQAGVYHDRRSPYRDQIKAPVRCFATVAAAKAAGARAPG